MNNSNEPILYNKGFTNTNQLAVPTENGLGISTHSHAVAIHKASKTTDKESTDPFPVGVISEH